MFVSLSFITKGFFLKRIYILLVSSATCNIFGAAELNYQPLCNAIARRDTQAARTFIEKNGEMDIDYPLNDRGHTPLQMAALSGNEELARLFLDNGANIEAKTMTMGYTPLLCAAMKGHFNLISFLLNRGADVNAANQHGSALHMAVYFRRRDNIRLLLEYGIDIQITDSNGNTAAKIAQDDDYDDIAELILSWGSDIKEPDVH